MAQTWKPLGEGPTRVHAARALLWKSRAHHHWDQMGRHPGIGSVLMLSILYSRARGIHGTEDDMHMILRVVYYVVKDRATGRSSVPSSEPTLAKQGS